MMLNKYLQIENVKRIVATRLKLLKNNKLINKTKEEEKLSNDNIKILLEDGLKEYITKSTQIINTDKTLDEVMRIEDKLTNYSINPIKNN